MKTYWARMWGGNHKISIQGKSLKEKKKHHSDVRLKTSVFVSLRLICGFFGVGTSASVQKPKEASVHGNMNRLSISRHHKKEQVNNWHEVRDEKLLCLCH